MRVFCDILIASAIFLFFFFGFGIDAQPQNPVYFKINPAVSDASLVIQSISEGAVIPRNMISLDVQWKEIPHADYALEIISGSGHDVVYSRKASFVISRPNGFPEIFTLRVYCRKNNSVYSGTPVNIRRSDFSLNDPVVYRCVEPYFDPSKTGIVYVQDVSSGERRMLFSAEKTCTGCHAYSSTAALSNVRRKGDRRLMIYKPGALPRGENIGTFSFLALSPDNKAMALIKDSTSRIELFRRNEEPFNMLYEKGILTLRDINSGKITASSGPDENIIYDMPVFSADSASVYFCKYSKEVPIPCISIFSADSSLENEKEVVHAEKGRYYYLPKTSPDGKWLSFVSGNASQGIFARKDSDIYIMNLKTKKISKLELNSGGMDSWHTWSSDSRWMAFSTNREPSKLTSVFLSSIDENGHASPPFKIAGFDTMKANMPVFAPGWDNEPSAELVKLLYEQEAESPHAE